MRTFGGGGGGSAASPVDEEEGGLDGADCLEEEEGWEALEEGVEKGEKLKGPSA